MALPLCLVEQQRRGDTDVQRFDVACHRDRDELVAGLAHERAQTLALGSEHEGYAAAQIRLPHRLRTVADGTEDPEVPTLDLAEVAREIRDDGDGHVLDRAGRRAAHRGRHGCGAVRRDDDARRARPVRAADDRAEIARVSHLVETYEQWTVDRRKLPAVGVLVGLTPREHALMVARAGRVAQLTFELRVHPGPLELAEPGLGLLRTVCRPYLEHLAAPAQCFAHRASAVDLLPRHFGTSWKPSATSRASHPAASISERRRSASSKLRAARASRRRSASSTISRGASAASARDARPKTSSARRSRS